MRDQALIFDFGNVLVHFDYGKATARLAATRGLDGRDLLDRLEQARWIELHHEYEHGRLTTEAFAPQWLALMGLEASMAEFEDAWVNIFTPNESIVPIIESLRRQGHRLILGSNTNALQAAHIQREYRGVLAHFDALILSCEIGRMKPHPEFYQACARAAGRPPAQCVFIDDLPANVVGAQQVGMTGLIYSTTPQLVADLASLGLVVTAQ